MSTESRRRRKIEAAASADPSLKTHVVVSLDTYMGDGEGAADYGYAGINDIFGPFTEEAAELFAKEREALNEFATEYRVYRLRA